MGEGDRDIGGNHAVTERAAIRIRGHHAQPARRHRGRIGAEAVKHPQPCLERPGPLDDHPVRRAPPEQPGDAFELGRGEPPLAYVLPRVSHLRQRPQGGGHLADPRSVWQHLEQPGQQRVIGGWIVAGRRRPVRRGAGGQDVRHGRGGQADPEIEPGQVTRQHPDERANPELPGQRDQIPGHRTLGQVDDREGIPAGQPRHADAGQQRRPACHGAADQIDPVGLFRQDHRIPQRLATERALAALPGPEPAGVFLLSGEQVPLLHRADGGDPAGLRGDGGLQPLPPPPGADRARRGQGHERQRAKPGQRRVQPACPAEQGHRAAQQCAAGHGQPGGTADQGFLPPLRGQPARVDPLRVRGHRAPRRQPRVCVQQLMLPAQADLAGLKRGLCHDSPQGAGRPAGSSRAGSGPLTVRHGARTATAAPPARAAARPATNTKSPLRKAHRVAACTTGTSMVPNGTAWLAVAAAGRPSPVPAGSGWART